MSRLVDDDESAENDLDYELNYACDMVIRHKNWPACLVSLSLSLAFSQKVFCVCFSALSSSLVSGHEALQEKRLRVWVLKKKRKWDGKVMNVNYCNSAPPLTLFQQNSCFKELQALDSSTDMSAFWTSPNTEMF